MTSNVSQSWRRDAGGKVSIRWNKARRQDESKFVCVCVCLGECVLFITKFQMFAQVRAHNI